MTQIASREHSEQSESTQRILKEHSESKSNQREREQSDFIMLSEPKILRLVNIENSCHDLSYL